MPQRIEVEDVGQVGIISDIHDYQLPLNAWSSFKNIRTDKNDIVAFPGHVLQTTAPHKILALNAVTTPTGHYWVYFGAAKAGFFNGTVHEDITPLAGDFVGTIDDVWTGTLINGRLVANNGVDEPVYWVPSSGNKLLTLPGWDSGWRATTMRSHKGFLIALGTVQAGVEYPYRVKWSHVAPPGDIPQSWDIADPSLLAGEQDLGDSTEVLIAGEPLRDTLLIYTEGQTYGMQFIGGAYVWRFYEISRTSGALSKRAVQTVRTTQVAATEDDIVANDGQQVRSIVNRRMREWMFRQLDQENRLKTFTVEHAAENEVWVCFPGAGATEPNIALVWNYLSDTWAVRDLPDQCMALARALDLTNTSNLTWATNPYTWNTWLQRWNERQYRTTSETLIGVSNDEIHRFDTSKQFDGVNRVSYAERIGLRLNPGSEKGMDAFQTVVSIWPRADGDPFEVQVGAQDRIDGPVYWEQPELFTPGEDYKVDVRSTGRYTAVRFQSTNEASWRLHGYGIEYERAGDR